MARKITEKSEIKRLTQIFQSLPKNKLELVDGLIVQAARERVRIDKHYKDMQETGETEMFCQSERVEPYLRKRPVTDLYQTAQANYRSILALLLDHVPDEQERSKLAEFLNGDG